MTVWKSEIRAQTRKVVTEAYPELAQRPLRSLGGGQFSIAVLVDEMLVLRFPHHAFGVGKLRSEADLLRCIGPYLPFPVPVPIRMELDREPPGAFVAHRFIPGRVVNRIMVDGLPAEEVDQVASAAGTFLAALHAIDVAVIPPTTPRRDLPSFARDLRAHTVDTLWPRMNAVGRRRAEEELAGLERITSRPEVLCHCDVGGNMIHDQARSRLGVIDFGEAMVTNPIFDVASLSVLGGRFMTAAASAYPLISECVDDARRLRSTFALQDALGGAAQDDWAYVDRILKRYQAEPTS